MLSLACLATLGLVVLARPTQAASTSHIAHTCSATDRQFIETTQLVLRRPAPAVDDLGAEDLPAEACVLVRLGPAQAVVDVQRRHSVPELTQDVPEAG